MRIIHFVPSFFLKHHTPLVKLRIYDPNDRLRTCALGHLPAIVGRVSEADIRVLDQWVSRVHCRLAFVNRQLVVRDLESRHGTFVNRRIIREQELLVGDILSIGMTKMEIVYIADSVPSAEGDPLVEDHSPGEQGLPAKNISGNAHNSQA